MPSPYKTCSYLPYPLRLPDGSRKIIRLPLVVIGLYFQDDPNEGYDSIALIDSGSMVTLSTKEDADGISLQYMKDKDEKLIKTPVQGAGGDFECNVAVVRKLDVKKGMNAFTTFRDLPVRVPNERGMLPYSILGRDSIFKRFDIAFYEGRKKMAFTFA